MNVLITGANGNLGQHFLKISSHNTIPITRDNWNNISEISKNNIDIVLHTAYDLKNSLYQNPNKIIQSNILTTSQALEECKKNKIKKFIFISSCAVYGDSSDSIESSSLNPTSFNGHTKLLNEKLVKTFCEKNGVDYLIARVFNTYGGVDKFSILYHLENAIKNNKAFILNNKGCSQRDFVHVTDVSYILNEIIKNNEIVNQTINIGTGQSTKICDIVHKFQKYHSDLIIDHSTNSEAEYSRANISLLEKYINHNFINVLDYIDTQYSK